MLQSRTIHTSDGITQQFSVSFPYLSRDHVSVTVEGVPTAITSWVDDSNIQITPAPAAGTANNIEIRRTTPDGLVSFSNGAAMTEDDLNTAVLAAQYQTEEAADEQESDDDSATSRLTIAEAQIAAISPKVTDFEDQLGAAFAFHSNGVAHSYNNYTPTIVPFALTMIGGAGAVNGEFLVPFDGFWLLTTSITPNPASLTVGDEWIISIGTRSSPSARRHWATIQGDPDTETHTFTCGLSLAAGNYVGVYIRRGTASGTYTLSTVAGDNTFTGFCIEKY